MRLVRDDAESPHLVLNRDGDAWRVRGLTSGTERTLEPEAVDSIEAAHPLDVAADALPTPDTGPLAIADDRTFGMAVLLSRAGPQPVHVLLETEGLCESDLHGLMGELGAAGLVSETTVDGQRGYRATETATEAVADLTA